MCGVYGIISRSRSPEMLQAVLSEMGKLLRHRGPDDNKDMIFPVSGGYLGLGLTRLAILDLETGMQPLVCSRDGSAIICNGQIYNYLELKPLLEEEFLVSRGDIEVALHLYRQCGLDFLHHLNGMYAGAIYDPPRNRLLLFRDRFGIKPLYYTRQAETFFFASEIKPLLAATGRPPRLNTAALPIFFTYRYLPGEDTLFAGIKRLPPGSFLDYNLQRDQYTIRRYWEYLPGQSPDQSMSSLSLDEAGERFLELLSDAVRLRLRSDVEVGTLLSGGIDSSAVSALAAGHQPDIRLFTMSFAEDKYNELPQVERFLRASASRFASARRHNRLCGRETLESLPGIVRSLEEPICLGTVLPTDQVCDLAAGQVKAVLTGEGADEIFAGYRKFLLEAAAGRYPDLPPEKQRALIDMYPELVDYLKIRQADPVQRYIQSELLFLPEELERLLGRHVGCVVFPENARPALTGREDALNAAIAVECRARLPDYVILRLDKLSMRHSLETRTPFLDYRLAEFAAALPSVFKADAVQGREKRICSHAYTTCGLLDSRTAGRKKQPFTIPLADWLATPEHLPDCLQEILLGNMIREQGILNPDMVRADLQRISIADTGPATLVSAADRVFAAIMFTLWYQEFFDISSG